MAILDLGLSTSVSGKQSLAGIRIYPGNSYPGEIYAVFSTESGTDWQDTFDISCSVRYVPKNGSGWAEDGYSEWSEFVWSNVPASECHPHQVAGNSRWWWAISFAQIGEYLNASTDPNPMGSIRGKWFSSGYKFDLRYYDALNFQIHVRSHFVSGKTDPNGNTSSNLAEANSLWVGYFPYYTLESARLTGSGLVIKYSATDWKRNDDRFAVRSISQSGNLLKPGNWFGTIDGYDDSGGTITIPMDWLISPPSDGAGLRIDIRMNASFRDIEMDFGEIVGSVYLIDETSCSTPTLRLVSADQDKVVIQLGDSNDHSQSYEAANCGISNDVLDTDLETVENGGQYIIYYPPLGREIHVWAIGTKGAEAFSGVASLTVPPIKGDGNMFIAPVDTGFDEVVIKYNVSESWSFEPNIEAVKFATRAYESVAFGYGGTSSGTVKFDIINDEAYGDDLYQEREPYEYLMFARLCVLRGPDGERRRVAVTNVDTSWDRYRQFRTVSISMKEVP